MHQDPFFRRDEGFESRCLSKVAERTTNAVVITDVERRIQWVNDAFVRMTGYRSEEVIGRSPGAILQSEETDPETVRVMHDAFSRGEGCRVEIINRGKNGDRYWLDLDIQPFLNDSGELAGFIGVESDVTPQIESRERLEVAERRLRMTVEGTDLGTWDWHIPSGEVVFNDRWCQMLGYRPDEIEGHVRSWEIVLHPEDQSEAMARLQAHFEGRDEIYRFEHRLKHKDGSVVWVLDSGRVYEWNERGEPVRMAGIHLDVTERRRAEERFELAATASVVGIWDRDLLSGSTYLSPRLYELLGYQGEKVDAEVLPRPDSVEPLIHPDDLGRHRELEARHIESREHFEIEFRLRTATGEYRWFQSRGEAVRNNDGRAIRMAGSLQDVHDRKLLEMSREVLASIVDNSQDSILSLAADGRISIANSAVRSMFGFEPEELIGRHYSEILVEQADSSEIDKVIHEFERVMSRPLETRCRRRDGSEVEVSIVASPTVDPASAIAGASLIIRDITDRREKIALQESARELGELNDLLERQNHRLEEMTDRAHRFVDDVSHEFRTPLTVIKEYTSIILDGLGGEISPTQAEWLRIIDVATVDLNTMVEDFLDSSKLRAGRLRVERRPHRVEAILDDIDRLLRRKAEAKGIRLGVEVARDLPEVFVDDEKARRVVMNLATNAIKFGPSGSEVRISGVRSDDGDIEVSIFDEGSGISEGDMQSLFERFRQLPNAMSPGVKGFGLGLNIARQLVWLNLGRLQVMNRPEGGACFRFTMPVNEPRTVLDRFFERLVECEDVPSRVGVLRVESVDPAVDADLIQRVACGSIRPSDICLPGAVESSCLVFGPTGSVSTWIERLRADWEGGSPDGIERSLRIVEVGDWPFEAEWRTAHRGILQLIEGATHA